MKKIIAIIALFISVVAYGQWGTTTQQVKYVHPTPSSFYKVGKSTHLTFKIGDYEFVGPMALGDRLYKSTKTAKGGEFGYSCDTEEEAQTLYEFIKSNKEEIEAKYDVVIRRVFILFKGVTMELYDRETFENSELAKTIERETAEQARKERMESLTTIL